MASISIQYGVARLPRPPPPPQLLPRRAELPIGGQEVAHQKMIQTREERSERVGIPAGQTDTDKEGEDFEEKGQEE